MKYKNILQKPVSTADTVGYFQTKLKSYFTGVIFLALIFFGLFGLAESSQAVTNVYYSVGQNATDHSSGGNVSITSGVATFTVAQVATNLGVGDRLTAGGNVYYLSSKTSTTVWNVVTALGAVPGDLGSTAVTSIAHEYTTLSAAEAGASDANHINNTSLVAADVILNIPCYYDSAADPTAVTVEGWTTGANNYIKIYTPNNTATEVNQSQRHSGKWDDTKYKLGAMLDSDTDYIRIEGLQIKIVSSLIYVHGIVATGTALNSTTDIRISNNIAWGVLSGAATNNWGILTWWGSSGSNTVKVWNNIVYGWVNGGASTMGGIFMDGITAYIYNNTIYDSYTGIQTSYSTAIAKNNLAYNSTDDYYGTFNGASTNNLSSDASAPPFGTYYRNATVNFVDATNKDFHLTAVDTGARNFGTDLSADANLAFSNDIDGDGRPSAGIGSWDIGADEVPGGRALVNSPNLPGGSKMRINMSLTDKMTSGLVGMWSFDGADMNWADTTTEAKDRSGNNNHGDVVGAIAAIGKRGQGLSFDGTGDYVYIPHHATLNLTSSMTLAAWVYTTADADNWDRIIDKGYATSYFFGAGDGTNDISFYLNNNDLINTANNALTLNEWQFLTATFDDSTNEVYLYKNGSQIGSNSYSGTITGNTNPLYIGGNIGSYKWVGKIDEARIYSRALSATEVGDLYRLGSVKIRR